MKKIIIPLLVIILCLLPLAGCASKPAVEPGAEPSAEPTLEPIDNQLYLDGRKLMIYCGAGMTEPFQEIADAFDAETGCEMQVTYANAGQI